MASPILVAFLLLGLYAVVSVDSSRPIEGGVETIWTAAAADQGDGGVARSSLPERSMIAVMPRRQPVRAPPSPKPSMAMTSYMPPCSGGVPGCRTPRMG
ncbi:Os06g0180300 [Oryza sativa Japonica Group]|uniref:Uncharacterized protein n=3 Tax=Oryza TaxID=4527 RepID=A3B8Z6_ORYSJ|nr:hypothetical protein OsJ_20342 [Oryza sativa Japonica Group]KAB8101466.1 hypothetical protein EE612_032274 [Oryza sativa]KAF2925480.1 hypothetical protein DAI22_06g056100 [Oryza sativa Japonica Group]BAD72307.1 hypothetical protein [Oryza sativa Japonica Group]BAD72560.1 hypothetical protein [Oryza sativa Japonica Group]